MTGSCGASGNLGPVLRLSGRSIPKNFWNFFWNQGPKYDLPGNNPDRGTSRHRGKRLFFKKAGKTLIVFKKNPNIRSGGLLKKVEKRVNDFGFFAYVIGGGHEKSKDFRKKLRFLLSVCRKNLNIHNEHTARKEQLPAKRKEERMQQTVKRIIKNRRTGMS